MEEVVLMRIPLLCQKRCRLRMTCFREWSFCDGGLGGHAAGPCRITWHECPLTAQTNPPVIQVTYIPQRTGSFLGSLIT